MFSGESVTIKLPGEAVHFMILGLKDLVDGMKKDLEDPTIHSDDLDLQLENRISLREMIQENQWVIDQVQLQLNKA